MLKKTFAMFDSGKTGMIDTDKIKTILNTLGQNFDDDELAALIEENDAEGKQPRRVLWHARYWLAQIPCTCMLNMSCSCQNLNILGFNLAIAGVGKCNFDSFATIVGHFLEEEDAEAMQQELKEAFRLYDKEGC